MATTTGSVQVSGMVSSPSGPLSPVGASVMTDRKDSSASGGMMNISGGMTAGNVSGADQTSPVQKSNSFATMLQERLRRGSDSNIKRAESMKMGLKPVKRAPSFTTRRRAQSFRKNQRAGGPGSESDASLLPPVEIQGMLERKHELQSGGKKAPHQRLSSGQQQYSNLPSPTSPGPAVPEVFGLADKPPIPPRGMPPPVPQRQSSTDNVLNNNGSVQMRSKAGTTSSPNGSDYDNANLTGVNRPYSLQPGAMSNKPPQAGSQNGNVPGEDVWLRNSEIRTSGWGQTRFDSTRPTSLPPASNNNNNTGTGSSTSGGGSSTSMGQDFGLLVSGSGTGGRHHSAESSSESEASFIKGGKEGSGKDKKGVFRIFSKKKSKNSS
uniref:Uncharacterized protein n=1 Tax=Anopheles coluzzii TaxID=1518534 RepID=A0A8W7PDM9_ANOCL